MNNSMAKKLCLQLMHADSEDEVVELLKNNGLWENKAFWRYYGDRETNFNEIGNQMSSADAALVEKVVNSVDARLTNACLVEGIDPTSNNAPKNIRDAVAKFFDDNPESNTAGLINHWLDFKRTEEAKNITLAATGYKPGKGRMSITISDKGEGQTPRMLPSTILSLDESNKLRIPFVQGRFNMGGTGVLVFCSPKHNLQLVLSRRNPKLNNNNQNDIDSKWGFTIVRREEPEGNMKNSVYTYLAPINANNKPRKGDVLSFSENEMPIFPENKEAYARNSKWGTLIKMYEYDISRSSHILMIDGLLHEIDLLIPETPLPIRFYECRNYGGHSGSFETTLTGLKVRLSDNKAENLEENFPSSSQIVVRGQKMDITIYAFKKGKADIYHSDEGILFVINGQTHGNLKNYFFRRKKVGLSLLRKDIIVLINCSNLNRRIIEDLFKNSRDRLSDNDLKKEIEDKLEEVLSTHQGLRELREKRRREEAKEKLSNSKPLRETLTQLISNSLTLNRLFLSGDNLSSPFKHKKTTDEELVFEGKKYPTFFKFSGKDYGETLRKNNPINGRCKIVYDTNAENEYFERDVDKGEFKITYNHNNETKNLENYSINLHNGKATLLFQFPDNLSVGDLLEFRTIVVDKVNFDGFINTFLVELIEPDTSRKKLNNRKNRLNNSKLQLPDIIRVRETGEGKTWDDMDPAFDKYSALRIIHVGHSENKNEKEIYQFYVNIDNFYLLHEIKNSNDDPELIEAKFVFGLVLLAMGMIHIDLETNDNGDDAYNIEDKVEEFSKGVASVLIPTIDNLGNLQLDDVED
jgi:hypothetical protein